MGNRAKFWLLGSIPLVLIVGLVVAGLWQLPQLDVTEAVQWRFLAGLMGGAALLTIAILAIWTYLDRACLAPLGTLGRGIRIVAHGNSGYEPHLPRSHLLGELPESVRDLGQALHGARREMVAAAAAGARELEEQKTRLKIVLRELSEGVLVCDAQARILLYNPAALKLLPNPEALAPGCSLYSFWTRAPIESTLELLQRQRHANADQGAGGDAEFVCATVNEQILLHCRMSLLPASAPHRGAVVITFRDLASRLQPLGQGRPQFDASLEDLRRPLASLRAAAENLSRAPDLEPGQRHAFQRILVAESAALSRNLETLARELRSLFAAQWPMNDVFSADLLAGVVRHLEQRVGPRVTPAGSPRWLHVDSHSIMLLVEHLVEQLYACGAASEFEIECLLGNRRVYLDIIWQGRPLPVPRVQTWASQRLQDLVGATTVGEVLARHNSELWSQGHRKAGHALLRLPLPASRRQWQQAGNDPVPAGRPEVYELSLGDEHERLGALAERPLGQLCYVVFDTETTGLEPAKGDEIIQLAGVRIVNRRIMADDAFERLVNPGKPIPRSSVRFHGITDDQVRDKPSIEAVLKQFKVFVGGADTVLISHNAAFDLRFLRLKQDKAGVRFENPVLDTLLLSAYVHDYTDTHTLEAIAERLGVTLRDRHRALGDVLITAQVFVRLLPLLEAHGVRTLKHALEASDKMAEIRRMQAQF